MPLTIDDPDIERLARELAAVTGEPLPRALAGALRAQLARVRAVPEGAVPEGAVNGRVPAVPRPSFGSVAEIQAYLAAQPELDGRTSEAILGYDAAGLPT